VVVDNATVKTPRPGGVRAGSQYSDSMHVALTEHYVKNVFGKNRKVHLNVGVFLEDTYGQFQVKDIRENGWEAHADYGTYLFEDGMSPPPQLTVSRL
jgi:hypothetical protein